MDRRTFLKALGFVLAAPRAAWEALPKPIRRVIPIPRAQFIPEIWSAEMMRAVDVSVTKSFLVGKHQHPAMSVSDIVHIPRIGGLSDEDTSSL